MIKLKIACPVLLLAALVFLVSCRTETPPSPTPADLSATTLFQTTLPPTTLIPSPLPGPDPAKLGTVEKDVTYGIAGNVSLKMDIYYPKTAGGALPVVMYVHGGAWTEGDKAIGAGATEIPEMIKRGYLTVSVNYRLAPAFKWPAMIEDVKCAVRFLRAKAAEYGLDPDRIGVWGGSAGGHLVSMLGATDVSAGFEGSSGYRDYSSRVQAVVDFFGPSDLNDLFRGYQVPLMEEVFGVTDAASQVLKLASPVSYISRDDPPFLIMQGDKDVVVPLRQSQTLYNRLIAGGVNAALVIVKNAGHSFIQTGGVMAPSRAEIIAMTADFFDKYLK
jgi:acetyl esterase/lipase